ncbi:hypothetical protein BJ912DRAFT_970504 [Pholiota molesta]|nr:hypothetical protein BJ912DRAFT_970504 [Pholiota molesta]
MLFLGVELYIMFFSIVIARRPLSPVIARWMYALNSAELHFPLLYLGAYIAGVKFITYFKFLLATTLKHKSIWLSAGFSIFVRVLFSVVGLHLIYRNYPETLAPFLDVRLKPALTLVPAGTGELLEEGTLVMYCAWAGYTLLAVPEGIIIAFWCIQALGRPWGKFARYAHLQVYVSLIFVIGNSVPLFDNIFARWAYLGLTTMFCAHYLGVGGAVVGGLTKRGWNVLRGSRRTSANAAPEGALSL